MEEGGIERMYCSQSGFCFDDQNLPVKNTDFIFWGHSPPPFQIPPRRRESVVGESLGNISP